MKGRNGAAFAFRLNSRRQRVAHTTRASLAPRAPAEHPPRSIRVPSADPIPKSAFSASIVARRMRRP